MRLLRTGAAGDAGAGRPDLAFSVSAVIIDLDGTLLDTVADLTAAVAAMLREIGRAPIPEDRVARYIGKGAEVLVHRAVTDSVDGLLPEAEFERAIESFRRHYARENGLSARVYPGVIEGLERMRVMGLRLAVVTNKPEAFTVPLLERTGLLHHFELVVGGDTLPRRKPDPMQMLHVCARFGISPERVVAIGDSVNDALAARAAGMPVFAVPYGYNEGADVRTLDVDAIVDSLFDATALIECA
ncbi:MAG: hypothetical protein RIS35_2398 [Pseudomonadota bacterium]|jgi:phosphoglycolate phosphatase